MTKNTEKYVKIDTQSFIDMGKQIELLKAHVKALRTENDILRDENETYFTANESLIKTIYELKNELNSIKSLSMMEFADKYCNDDELEEAGKAFAQSLIGGH